MDKYMDIWIYGYVDIRDLLLRCFSCGNCCCFSYGLTMVVTVVVAVVVTVGFIVVIVMIVIIFTSR